MKMVAPRKFEREIVACVRWLGFTIWILFLVWISSFIRKVFPGAFIAEVWLHFLVVSYSAAGGLYVALLWRT